MKFNQWALNSKGVVVSCPYDCTKHEEHFVGSYEAAMKYFLGTNDVEVNSYGDLMNVVRYHQLLGICQTKTSAELFDILMRNAKTKKYWIPESVREKEVLEVLKQAKEMNLIYDDEIIQSLERHETQANYRRVAKQKKFEKTYLES